MAKNDRSPPPPPVEIPPQNLAPSGPLGRVLREFGVADATGVETGTMGGAVRANSAEATARAEAPTPNTYYAKLVATALEITVTAEESQALVEAGAKVRGRQAKP